MLIHFKKILLIVVAGFLMGCYNPNPIPEVAIAPTPVPDEGWTCFTGKIEMVNGTAWEPRVSMTIIGEQIICAKEWRISNLYGPVGTLESSPDNPLTFGDLNKTIEAFKNPPTEFKSSQ